MSFLDLDEWLVDLCQKADVVHSPFVDVKEYPENVDVVLVEGAVCNEDHLEIVRRVRQRSKIIISFGDCAVTGNVTALRNALGSAGAVLRRAYIETADVNPQIPAGKDVVPPLLDRVLPVHEIIRVEYYLPGCPPPADRIKALLVQLLEGGEARLAGEQIRFG
jgi:NAD-reducing hydrogenase small subunit